MLNSGLFIVLAFITFAHFALCFVLWGWKWALFARADKRPAILNQKHADFLPFLRWVPRSLTAFLSVNPPYKLLGNETGHLDIPQPGHWCLCFPGYFAVTALGWHARIGCRWDTSDLYYQVPSASIKRWRAS